MEKNGIMLTELSCRTAAELPPPELPKLRRQSSGSSGGKLGGSPAAQLLKHNMSSTVEWLLTPSSGLVNVNRTNQTLREHVLHSGVVTDP
ncbi:unnamed protein product [Boreogadus saida]